MGNPCELLVNRIIILTTIATNLAIWLAYLPLSIEVWTTLVASLCYTMLFSAHALKNIVFDVDIVVKKTNRNVV